MLEQVNPIMNPTKKIILITGCSTGIGLSAVKTLSQRGHRVIASCRKMEDVKRLTDLGFETVLLDVSDLASLASVFNSILDKTEGKLDVLINNAGYGQGGALEDLSYEALVAQFNTNVFGLMELSRLAIGLMRKQGHGRIINVSSVLGLISMPFKGAYTASKYAVEGLSDTLRLELHSSGIKVITVEPGPIESDWVHTLSESLSQADTQHSVFKESYDSFKSQAAQKKSKSFFTKKADAVVNKFIHAIESDRPRKKYPVTFVAYLFIFLKRILPTSLMDRFLLLAFKFS